MARGRKPKAKQSTATRKKTQQSFSNFCQNPLCGSGLPNSVLKFCPDKPQCQLYRGVLLSCQAHASSNTGAWPATMEQDIVSDSEYSIPKRKRPAAVSASVLSGKKKKKRNQASLTGDDGDTGKNGGKRPSIDKYQPKRMRNLEDEQVGGNDSDKTFSLHGDSDSTSRSGSSIISTAARLEAKRARINLSSTTNPMSLHGSKPSPATSRTYIPSLRTTGQDEPIPLGTSRQNRSGGGRYVQNGNRTAAQALDYSSSIPTQSTVNRAPAAARPYRPPTASQQNPVRRTVSSETSTTAPTPLVHPSAIPSQRQRISHDDYVQSKKTAEGASYNFYTPPTQNEHPGPASATRTVPEERSNSYDEDWHEPPDNCNTGSAQRSTPRPSYPSDPPPSRTYNPSTSPYQPSGYNSGNRTPRAYYSPTGPPPSPPFNPHNRSPPPRGYSQSKYYSPPRAYNPPGWDCPAYDSPVRPLPYGRPSQDYGNYDRCSYSRGDQRPTNTPASKSSGDKNYEYKKYADTKSHPPKACEVYGGIHKDYSKLPPKPGSKLSEPKWTPSHTPVFVRSAPVEQAEESLHIDWPSFTMQDNSMFYILQKAACELPAKLAAVENKVKKGRKLRFYTEYANRVKEALGERVDVKVEGTSARIVVDGRDWLDVSNPTPNVSILYHRLLVEVLTISRMWKTLIDDARETDRTLKARGEFMLLGESFLGIWSRLKAKSELRGALEVYYWQGDWFHHWIFAVGKIELGHGSSKDKVKAYAIAADDAMKVLLKLGNENFEPVALETAPTPVSPPREPPTGVVSNESSGEESAAAWSGHATDTGNNILEVWGV